MADDALPDPASPDRVLALTAQIVSAHVRRNAVPATALPELIRAVHRALDGLGQPQAEATPSRPEPAVPVRRSVQADAITCLECGQRFKMLKRHLATDHGLSPEEYRARWELPRDYPVVAPDYAATRSGLAKQAGFGRKRAPDAEVPEEAGAQGAAAVPGIKPEPAIEAAPVPGLEETAPAPATKRRGRPRKVLASIAE